MTSEVKLESQSSEQAAASDHSNGNGHHHLSGHSSTFSIATPVVTQINGDNLNDASFLHQTTSYHHHHHHQHHQQLHDNVVSMEMVDTSQQDLALQTEANVSEHQQQQLNNNNNNTLTSGNVCGPPPVVAASIDVSKQPEVTSESTTTTAAVTTAATTTASGTTKKKTKTSKKGLKLDTKSKLEKSRQSARECRARKKLRYQYLEDLVSNREKAVVKLREELSMFCDMSKHIDTGTLNATDRHFLTEQTKENSK